jgi:hypothetical protein
VKRSTPTTPQSSKSSQPDVPQGSLSARHYAPHLTEPDEVQEMTDEQCKMAARKMGEMMRARGM